MKKKIFGALIISVLALGLTGCGSKKTEYKTLNIRTGIWQCSSMVHSAIRFTMVPE